MSSRATEHASGRLKRAKSTSSVPRSIPSNSNAVTAASLAFERAQAARMHSLESNDQPRVTRRRSIATNRLSGEGSHLSRRTSKLRSWTDEPRKTRVSGSEAARERRRFTTNNGFLKPRSEASNPSVTSPDMRFANRFDGYGLPANARLRKTQSCATHSTTTPSREGQAPNLIRRLTVAAPATRENQTDEAILALARDRYLHEHQMTPLRKRSSFFAPFTSKSRKSKRDSTNTDMTVSQGQHSVELQWIQGSELAHMPATDVQQRPSEPKTGPSTSTSLRVSSSLSSIKSSWKRTFGRGSRSSSGTTEMPPQHIVARMQHYGRPGLEEPPNQTISNTYDGVEITAPASPSPPTPPPHLVDVRHSFSHEGEATSLVTGSGGSAYDESRITSWADSTRQSTLVGADQDHLPSIEESPESRKASVLPGQSRGEFRYQGTSAPLRKSSSRFSLRGTVDGKRLFSALMRHKSDRPESCSHATLDLVREYTNESAGEDENDVVETSSIRNAPNMTGLSNGARNVTVASAIGDSTGFSHSTNVHLDEPSRGLQIVSPSVYSERNDSAMQSRLEATQVRIPTEPGMATVMTSEAVSKWPLAKASTGHKQSTSNEWRAWAAGETAGLEGRASFSLPAFSSPEPTNGNGGQRNTRSNTPEDKGPTDESRRTPPIHATPDTPDWIEGPSAASDLPIGAPTVSISASRDPSNATSMMSRASQRSSSGIRRVLGINKVKEELKGAPPDVGREPSNMDLLSRRTESPYQVRTMQRSRQSGSRIPRHPRKPLPSAIGNSSGSPSRGHELDDNFLLAIRKGPYNASTNSFACMPTRSADTLSISKRSPTTSRNENTPPSRGQRMANDFLSKRRNGTNQGDGSPAFV